MIEFTEWAVDILARADEAARRFNPEARLRLRGEGSNVVFELTDEPAEGDRTIDHDAGFTLFVAGGLEGTVDVVEPHDQLILRRPGDPARSVREGHGS